MWTGLKWESARMFSSMPVTDSLPRERAYKGLRIFFDDKSSRKCITITTSRVLWSYAG